MPLFGRTTGHYDKKKKISFHDCFRENSIQRLPAAPTRGYTYSCDRRTTDGMELLFIFREDGHSRYYFESDMEEFDRKAASDSHTLTVYPRPDGDGEVSLLHRKRATTDRFFLFRLTKPGVTLTGEMSLWDDETPIGTGLPMLFDFLDEVRIQNIEVK